MGTVVLNSRLKCVLLSLAEHSVNTDHSEAGSCQASGAKLRNASDVCEDSAARSIQMSFSYVSKSN